MVRDINVNGYKVTVSSDGKYIAVNGVNRSLTLIHTKKNSSEFYQVTLYKNKKMYVHRLVAMTFCNGNGKLVLHKDTNTTNNHYTNLMWGDYKEISKNIKKAGREFTVKRSSLSKIKEKDIFDIIKRLNNKETLRSIAKDYNTSDMSIHRIKKRFNIK